MPHSTYFEERAAHYRGLAIATPNTTMAASLFGLANLFHQLANDLRTREFEAKDPAVYEHRADVGFFEQLWIDLKACHESFERMRRRVSLKSTR